MRVTCDKLELARGRGTIRQGGRPTVAPDLTLDVLAIPVTENLLPLRPPGPAAKPDIFWRLRRL